MDTSRVNPVFNVVVLKCLTIHSIKTKERSAKIRERDLTIDHFVKCQRKYAISKRNSSRLHNWKDHIGMLDKYETVAFLDHIAGNIFERTPRANIHHGSAAITTNNTGHAQHIDSFRFRQLHCRCHTINMENLRSSQINSKICRIAMISCKPNARNIARAINECNQS